MIHLVYGSHLPRIHRNLHTVHTICSCSCKKICKLVIGEGEQLSAKVLFTDYQTLLSISRHLSVTSRKNVNVRLYLLFDHFDVHEVVSIITNCHTKVHGHSVVLSRLEHRDPRGRRNWQVYISPIHLCGRSRCNKDNKWWRRKQKQLMIEKTWKLKVNISN